MVLPCTELEGGQDIYEAINGGGSWRILLDGYSKITTEQAKLLRSTR